MFIPKCRRKVLYGKLRKKLGEIFHQLAAQRECTILEGHCCGDHVHMLIRIPPKYAVSHVVGYIKGKSAIMVAREFLGRERNFVGHSFGARGYFVSTVGIDVSTVGIDEATIRQYVRNQETEDRRTDQPRLFK